MTPCRRSASATAAVAALALAALSLAAAEPATAGSYLVFVDDEAGFVSALGPDAVTSVTDSGGAFAPDASAAGGLGSVSRSGSAAGQPFAFTVYDFNFTTSASPPGTLVPGAPGGDVGSVSTLDVETPVRQGGATGVGSFGYDSSTGGVTSRNALLVDFTTTPGGLGVAHFALDLVDFEASAAGTPGSLRLYDAGVLVFSHTFSYPGGGTGNDETHFLGVVALGAPSCFDQVVLVVGDDDPGGSGNGETWAADRLRFGTTINPEPGTWALFGIGAAALAAGVVRRRRARAAKA